MGNTYMEASQINYRGGETKMSVEEALKNTSGEAAAIAALQTAVGNLQGGKADLSVIAPAFSAETAYAVGDIVSYEGVTYRCTTAHEGEWDATDFAATTIANELSSLESGLTNLISVYTGVLPASASDTCYISHTSPRAWQFLVETSNNVWQDLTEASYIQGNAIFVYMPSEKIAPHFGKNYRFVVV